MKNLLLSFTFLSALFLATVATACPGPEGAKACSKSKATTEAAAPEVKQTTENGGMTTPPEGEAKACCKKDGEAKACCKKDGEAKACCKKDGEKKSCDTKKGKKKSCSKMKEVTEPVTK